MSETDNTVIRVKEKYREAILADTDLHGKVAKACGKSLNTIYRWCKDNAQQLTMLSVLNAIREHLKLSKDTPITEHIKESQLAA